MTEHERPVGVATHYVLRVSGRKHFDHLISPLLMDSLPLSKVAKAFQRQEGCC